MRTKLSQNFYADEFHCKCCGKGVDKIDPYLINLLQVMRDMLGRGMKVTSGYRCAKHNKAVGGSLNSDHLKGKAADILCVDGYRRKELVHLALTVGVPVIGVKRDCIHLSTGSPERMFTYD